MARQQCLLETCCLLYQVSEAIVEVEDEEMKEDRELTEVNEQV